MTMIDARGSQSRQVCRSSLCITCGYFIKVSDELGQEASLYNNVNEKKKNKKIGHEGNVPI